jgi:membrane protein implicated in regulation of membrane protease activity
MEMKKLMMTIIKWLASRTMSGACVMAQGFLIVISTLGPIVIFLFAGACLTIGGYFATTNPSPANILSFVVIGVVALLIVSYIKPLVKEVDKTIDKIDAMHEQ